MEKNTKPAAKLVDENKAGGVKLPEKIFKAKVRADLLAQYLRIYFANQRAGTASTKTKGEVSGGGRKPWRQKGTGRARQGSIRSPQWVGGGVVHGPKPKDWALSLPSKMKRLALLSALSLKARAGKVDVWDSFSYGKEARTRDLAADLRSHGFAGRILFIRTEGEEELVRIGRNLALARIEAGDCLNAFAVTQAEIIIFSKASLAALEKHFNKTEL